MASCSRATHGSSAQRPLTIVSMRPRLRRATAARSMGNRLQDWATLQISRGSASPSSRRPRRTRRLRAASPATSVSPTWKGLKRAWSVTAACMSSKSMAMRPALDGGRCVSLRISCSAAERLPSQRLASQRRASGVTSRPCRERRVLNQVGRSAVWISDTVTTVPAASISLNQAALAS